MAILNQEQFARLVDTLTGAFDFFTLNVLVGTRIDTRGLFIYVPGNATYEFQAYALAQRAETDDFTAKLIVAARELRPNNAALLQLAHELGLTSFGAPTEKHIRLESLIRQSNLFRDFAMWRMRLTEIESRVCCIELQGTKHGQKATASGTGFLIGPDRVLTNYHVIEPLLQTTAEGFKAEPENVTVRFDFKRLRADVLYPGDEFHLAQQWQVDSSPYESDETPTSDELDYALIQLDGKAGERVVAGWSGIPNAPKRGWFPLAETNEPFAPGTPLIIVQHPLGDPLQIAFDTDSIIGQNANHTRVRYRTNTLGGSSGSPCFNAALELVALHHAGDPSYGPPMYNAGIPINAIVARLKKRPGVDLP